MIDVGEGHMQDHAYFAAIDEEMNNGGREALLDFLLRFDLKSVNLRAIPKTGALLEQKIASLSPEKGWWLDVLTRGELPWGCEGGTDSCPTSRLIDQYVRHASRHGARRRAIETQIGMFLSKYVPGLRKSEGSFKRWTNSRQMIDVQGSIYTFPSLQECRATFSKKIQQEIKWGERERWTVEPPPDGYDDANSPF